MDENENTNDTPNTDAPADNPGTGDAPANDTPNDTPPANDTADPVIPEGYVKAEEVETERNGRVAAETARTEAETRATAAEARARASEIRLAAQALGFNDPADAVRFIDADVTDIEGALASVIEAKPYLRKATDTVKPPVTPTNPTNPARPEALTMDAIKGMSAAQLAARWSDVKQVLASNR